MGFQPGVGAQHGFPPMVWAFNLIRERLVSPNRGAAVAQASRFTRQASQFLGFTADAFPPAVYIASPCGPLCVDPTFQSPMGVFTWSHCRSWESSRGHVGGEA